MKYLELNSKNVVVNIVVWDGVSEYAPNGVTQILPCDENPGVSYGWRLVDGEWVAPPPVEPQLEEPIEE
jgi:hypothetical protein